VREISTKDEIERSVRFSWKVYKDYPAWVPYFLIKDHVKLISNDYFYFRKVYGKRFVVEERGEIVGTVSAFIDNYYNRYHDTNVGFLGFFEALLTKKRSAFSLPSEEFLRGVEIQGRTGYWPSAGPALEQLRKIPSFLQVYTQPYYHDYFTNAGSAG
jgi:hypothetical protein